MSLRSRLVTWLLLSTFLVSMLVSFPVGPAQAQTLTYKIGMQQMADAPHIYEFVINNNVVLRYRSMSQGLSARERADILLDRVKKLGNDFVSGPIEVGKIDGSFVIKVQGKLLITVTEADWQANQSTPEGLARVWAANLTKALGKTTPVELEPKTPAPSPQAPVPATPPKTSTQNSTATVEEQKMLELINKERALAGVAPLAMDNAIVKVARLKSQDMIDKNYFDHTSPTYGDPFTMLKNHGIKYGYAGENLAGNQTVEAAHTALMNSPGHKRNILSPNYTHVGIGIAEGGSYGKIFTQLFISK